MSSNQESTFSISDETYGCYTGDRLRMYLFNKYEIPLDTHNLVSENRLIVNNTLRCVRNKYLATASCQEGGPYYDAFKRYTKYIKELPGYNYIDNFTPCSGDTVEKGMPWVDFTLASNYLSYLANDKKLSADYV